MNPDLECKGNNAAFVKRIMPEGSSVSRRKQPHSSIYDPIRIGFSAQKGLDTASDKSIMIFTYIVGSRTANGRPGHQAPDASTTGNAEPAPEGRTRRTVSSGRFLRCPRSGAGQIGQTGPIGKKTTLRVRTLPNDYLRTALGTLPVCQRHSSLRKPKEIVYKQRIICFAGGRWSSIGYYLRKTEPVSKKDAGITTVLVLRYSFACYVIPVGRSDPTKIRPGIC